MSLHRLLRFARAGLWAVVSALLFPLLSPAADPERGADSRDDVRVETWLRDRLGRNPRDAAAWRMWGRLQLKRNSLADARRAFERATALDPNSAAAFFDLGRTLLRLEKPTDAEIAFQQVQELAPGSTYDTQAAQFLQRIAREQPKIQQADYRIKRFDGLDVIEPLVKPNETLAAQAAGAELKTFDFLLEAGALYNSNVALAPLSRELTPSAPASATAFLAPQMQWAAIDRKQWRAGPLFSGRYTLNEGDLKEFNLQSYQPGLFFESFHAVNGVLLISRVGYLFTHDEFNGRTFGNRHALSPSLLVSWTERDATLVYWSIDHSRFASEGPLPSVTSQDGLTNTIGFSHDHRMGLPYFKLIRAGADFTRADTDGTDFRFNGVNLSAELVFDLTHRIDLKLRGGWGYRDYPDFQFTPSRNENIWRAGAEVEKSFTDRFSVAAVFNFVRFDSGNPLFTAEQYLAGVVTRWKY
jgi:hypothetical protein